MIKISESSFFKISWGALVFICSITIGFSVWMTSIDSSTANAEQNIAELKEKNDDLDNVLTSIDKRLQRIEVILEELFLKKRNK